MATGLLEQTAPKTCTGLDPNTAQPHGDTTKVPFPSQAPTEPSPVVAVAECQGMPQFPMLVPQPLAGEQSCSRSPRARPLSPWLCPSSPWLPYARRWSGMLLMVPDPCPVSPLSSQSSEPWEGSVAPRDPPGGFPGGAEHRYRPRSVGGPARRGRAGGCPRHSPPAGTPKEAGDQESPGAWGSARSPPDGCRASRDPSCTPSAQPPAAPRPAPPGSSSAPALSPDRTGDPRHPRTQPAAAPSPAGPGGAGPTQPPAPAPAPSLRGSPHRGSARPVAPPGGAAGEVFNSHGLVWNHRVGVKVCSEGARPRTGTRTEWAPGSHERAGGGGRSGHPHG
ncbi:uncharacterized protein LOC115600367 [Calypte anna]|uniref:uncharacterized protein LOC115600367 n=1 Tax=Calypte anna TaxID=9244 RepID=UPI0011C42DE6|nr:uncharacterized protein LOC115600367 [Calypte anna]